MIVSGRQQRTRATHIHVSILPQVFNLPLKEISPFSEYSVDSFEYIVLHYGSKFNKVS